MLLPWSEVLSKVVEDPEPLYTLHARVRLMAELSRVDRSLHMDVVSSHTGWPALADSLHVDKDVRKRIDEMPQRLHDMETMTDAQVNDIVLFHRVDVDANGNNANGNIQEAKRRALVEYRRWAMRNPAQAKLRLALKKERVPILAVTDALHKYGLSRRDPSYVRFVAPYIQTHHRMRRKSVEEFRAMDACLAKYGSSARLVEAREERAAATERKKRNKEERTLREEEFVSRMHEQLMRHILLPSPSTEHEVDPCSLFLRKIVDRTLISVNNGDVSDDAEALSLYRRLLPCALWDVDMSSSPVFGSIVPSLMLYCRKTAGPNVKEQALATALEIVQTWGTEMRARVRECDAACNGRLEAFFQNPRRSPFVVWEVLHAIKHVIVRGWGDSDRARFDTVVRPTFHMWEGVRQPDG